MLELDKGRPNRLESSEKPQDECAVVGVYSKSPNIGVVERTLNGLLELNHRGQESSGIAVTNGEAFRLTKDRGLATIVFTLKHELPDLQNARIAVGQNRYSTAGSIEESQPFVENDIAIAHNGNLTNINQLREQYRIPKEIDGARSDTRIALAVINKMHGDPKDKILAGIREFEGAFSFVFATKDALFASRDPNGFRPLSLGKIKGDEGFAVASETAAFKSMGLEFVRDVQPGETIMINDEGATTVALDKKSKLAQCVFELIYIARPDSTVFGIPVMDFRIRQGKILASHMPDNIDAVVPVPLSGIGAAAGGAEASMARGIPYSYAIITNAYRAGVEGQRTFIRPNGRDKAATEKYSVIESLVRGKRLAIFDDSVVRGSLKVVVQKLKEAGAEEVHAFIASPPIRYSCHFGVDFGDGELLARKIPNQEERAEYLGLDSLTHLSYAETMEAALGNPVKLNKDTVFEEAGFCGSCFTGRYPVSTEGVITKSS